MYKVRPGVKPSNQRALCVLRCFATQYAQRCCLPIGGLHRRKGVLIVLHNGLLEVLSLGEDMSEDCKSGKRQASQAINVCYKRDVCHHITSPFFLNHVVYRAGIHRCEGFTSAAVYIMAEAYIKQLLLAKIEDLGALVSKDLGSNRRIKPQSPRPISVLGIDPHRRTKLKIDRKSMFLYCFQILCSSAVYAPRCPNTPWDLSSIAEKQANTANQCVGTKSRSQWISGDLQKSIRFHLVAVRTLAPNSVESQKTI